MIQKAVFRTAFFCATLLHLSVICRGFSWHVLMTRTVLNERDGQLNSLGDKSEIALIL